MKLSKFLFTLSFIGLSLLATQESIPAGQMNQTIDTISLSDTSLTVGGSTTLNATATSGLPVSFTSTSPTICTISNNKIKGITVGDCLVIASQAGNVNYKPALQTLKVINVAKGNQAIGVIRLNPATLTIGGTTTISAVTTSKLPITFNSSTPSTCAVLGNTITAVTTGTCTIMAIQAGDANYNPAPVKSTNITIGKGNQTIGAISFNPPTLAVGGTTTASAMATSNLPVSFSTTTSFVCTTGGTNGSTVSGVAGGICTVAADQAGDINWSPAPQVTQSLTVNAVDPLTVGLVAYYPFNGNANDESGNGNNGTVNGATLTTDRDGNANSSYNFNGNGKTNYISTKIPTINISSGAQVTVVFWMYWNGGSGMPISFNENYDLWFIGDGTFGFNTLNSSLYGISDSGLANKWMHVAAIFTNNDTYLNNLYINGGIQSLSRLSSYNQSKRLVSPNMMIGNLTSGPSYTFDGKIDDVRVYNRALSGEEISTLYSAERPVSQ